MDFDAIIKVGAGPPTGALQRDLSEAIVGLGVRRFWRPVKLLAGAHARRNVSTDRNWAASAYFRPTQKFTLNSLQSRQW